jgi:hypothetical protein
VNGTALATPAPIVIVPLTMNPNAASEFRWTVSESMLITNETRAVASERKFFASENRFFASENKLSTSEKLVNRQRKQVYRQQNIIVHQRYAVFTSKNNFALAPRVFIPDKSSLYLAIKLLAAL